MIQPRYTADEIAALQTAYERAFYEVYRGAEAIALRVGHYCPKLDALMTKEGFNSWALITAYNPYSQCLSAPENQQRHQKLIEQVQKQELSYLSAVGRDTDGVWIPEQSLCIFNVGLQKAISIGRMFAQNAIVYGELNRPIKLQWL